MMRFRSFHTAAGLAGAACLSAAALADPGGANRLFNVPALTLQAQDKPAEKPAAKPADKPADKPAAKPADKPAEKPAATSPSSGEYEFGGLGDFWNVREANANLKEGQFNFETTWVWSTTSDGTDDDLVSAFALRYGINDQMFLELEVYPINYGDGQSQGNGDIGLLWFWNVMKETDEMPAFGTYLEMRIPSGDGSRGVDGEWHWILTKTLMPKFRAHFEGFIQTANGGRGEAQDFGRRPFQWGVGPGFDYAITDNVKAVLNYQNRSSDQVGNQNTNILEVGVASSIAENQYLCLAVDIGLDDGAGTPNFATKVQWGITWK